MSHAAPSLKMNPPQPSAEVLDVFDQYPTPARIGICKLRDLIYDVAAGLPAIGAVSETLRWGQPAYLTPETGAASTLRLGVHRNASFAIFAHCRTNIISSYAEAFPGWDQIDGNRAVLFDDIGQIEPERLARLIRHGLTYHLK